MGQFDRALGHDILKKAKTLCEHHLISFALRWYKPVFLIQHHSHPWQSDEHIQPKRNRKRKYFILIYYDFKNKLSTLNHQ